jgi:mono/diheme cytochrome c family protein
MRWLRSIANALAPVGRAARRWYLLALALGVLAVMSIACGREQPTPQLTPRPLATSTATPLPRATQPTLRPPTVTPAPAPSPQPNQDATPFGFGRDATPEEIRLWDIDVRPDGTGLPPGSGTVAQGAEVYARKCAACHGESGEGVPGASGALVMPYATREPWPQFPRTVGNYWPYATTLFDYIKRAMPTNAPGSLEPDEIYSVVAWLLYRNQIIGSDAVMSKDTLPLVKMPASGRFVPAPGVPAQ